MNILSLLSERAKSHPDKIAFAFRLKNSNMYNEISFKELDQRSSRAAIYLENNGFKRGMKTLVMVRPSIDFIILIYGMFKLGVIPLFPPNLDIKSRNGRKQLRLIISRAKINALIGSRKILFISWLLRLRVFSQKILSLNQIKSYYSNSNNKSEYFIDSNINWLEEPVFVKYTTGSTGPAKGVIYNHAMLHSHIKILESEGINSNDIFFGRAGTLIVHPLIGMTSILHTNKPKQTTGEEIVRAINRWSISACFLSPPSAINLSNYLEGINEPKITTLERLYVGGESVSSKVVRNIEPHLSPNRPKDGGFHLVYGATEGFPLCQNQAKHIFQTEFETKSGKGICLGIPVKGVRIRILTFKEPLGDFDNSSAVDVSGDSIGEISVCGSVVYTRLVGDDEELFGGPLTWALDKNDGSIWHRTGDLGYTDHENRIWLVGRKKHRVELSNGITLYPKQIEPVLDSMFGIRTALVNGPNNIQASIIVEDNGMNWNILQGKLIQSIPILCELLGDNIDFSFTLYSDTFPVDSGHEAKIRREALSHWLCDKS
ncbi:hypothetical protein CL649_03605 [bacterium]|jgi:acyl-CoA synthetase (AMP-forming)/AMP-acid ligase II|nr:hypothetical protein [bacterium]|tara:strand:+ start:631 stop:2262 length:1632 start_codon:yes stop_codon:yes gene_type:complete